MGEAGTVADALARIPPARPDVAILDVRLPDGSGVEVCREIRSMAPQIACVMLTSYGRRRGAQRLRHGGCRRIRPSLRGGAARGNQPALTTSRSRRGDDLHATKRVRGSTTGLDGPGSCRRRISAVLAMHPSLARPFPPGRLCGLPAACAPGLAGGRAGGPKVGEFRRGALLAKRTPELENGDRGGWPPFSKHRCLGRGGCPRHSGCAPPVRVEPKVMDCPSTAGCQQ